MKRNSENQVPTRHGPAKPEGQGPRLTAVGGLPRLRSRPANFHRESRALFALRPSDFGLLAVFLALLLPALVGHAAFVYESPAEFLTTADFNGDGVPDVLALDKLTGNARIGYGSAGGVLTWSPALTTGVPNASGCAAGRFRLTIRDVLAVTAPNLNRVNLYDLGGTNTASLLGVSLASGLGPHSLAALAAPFGPPAPPYGTLLVASAFNDSPAERLDVVTNFNIGVTVSTGQYPETGSFERANALPLVGGPTLAVGLVRGTNDTLHLWQFTNSPAVTLSLSNLPAGSDYAFGWFNGETLPRFVFYVPGQSNVTLQSLVLSNGALAFGPAVTAPLSEPVQQVVYDDLGADGEWLFQFGDGVQGARMPGGSLALAAVYRNGLGAAGRTATGVVPLGNGRFALLSTPAGGTTSLHAEVARFDGTSYTSISVSDLPAVTSSATRANAWLFQFEPFVNRDPGFIASVNAADWADAISGLPGSLTVVRESDGGASSGLGSATSVNLGTPATGSAYGLPNQYNPAISVFTYASPQAAEPVAITIAPPPGAYAAPIQVSFSVLGGGRLVFYRAGAADTWHQYTAPFMLTNDATVQYYGTTILSPTRSGLQFASYTVGNAGGTPPSPVNTIPGNTNPPPVLNTNQVLLSANGTVFYGRRSANNAYTVWSINLDGSGETYITTGARPRVSRDGRYLAFLRGGSKVVTEGDPWVRDLVTGQESMLFTNVNYIIGYDWDRTGTNLVFDWSCWLWRIGLTGPAALLPLATDCYDDAPTVNPVDGRLAFHNLDPNLALEGIYVTSSNLATKQLLSLNVPGASWPAWAPDGQQLAFVDGNSSNTAFSVDAGKNLWVVNDDGSGLNQISGFTDTVNGFPHGAIWSPDGSALIAAGNIFGTNGLWVIPLTPDHTDCDGPPIRLPTSLGDAVDFAGSVVATPAAALPPPPGLFIRQDPDAVVVYWSTNYAGFTLESATNLPSGGFWTAINGPYYLAPDGYFEYREANASLRVRKIFRLHYTGAMVFSTGP